jgi:glycosyltransferase involved in cell wall biosynthesis
LHRGRYDVLHCHHDLVSALYLLASTGLSIRRRIVHVHNADEALPTPSRFKQHLFREPMRRVCLTMADRVVGISGHTLDKFLSGRARRGTRDVVHYYGLNPAPVAKADRSALRRELGLPSEALILLFAGRLVPEKQPLFALDVMAELHRLEPRAVGVFAGAGSLEQVLRSRSREAGLESVVRLLGWRTDVPEIMGCCDWFILPHPEQPMEGFGVAVVEAQLAGLRMLLSTGVADDPLLPTASFRRLSLSAGPKTWALAAADLMRTSVPSRTAAATALQNSQMNMDRALDGLIGLHV